MFISRVMNLYHRNSHFAVLFAILLGAAVSSNFSAVLAGIDPPPTLCPNAPRENDAFSLSPGIFLREAITNPHDFNHLLTSDFFTQERQNTCLQSHETVYRGVPNLGGLIKKPTGLRLRGNGFYDHARVFPKNAENMRSEMTGFLGGVDLLYKNGSVFGAYYMYGNEETSWDSSALPFRGSVAHHLVGIQYKKNFSSSHFLFNGSLGKDEYDYNGNVFEKYMGDGYQGNLYAELGIGLSRSNRSMGLKPFWAIHYHSLELDDFEFDDFTNINEYINLADSVDYHGLNNILGVRFNLALWGGKLNTQIRTSWVYEYLDSAPTSTNYFGTVPGQYTPLRWNVEGNTSKSHAWLGGGLKFSLGKRILCFLDYDANFNAYRTSHTGSIYLCVNF